MKKFRVFISSVQREFQAERLAIEDYLQRDALLLQYFEPVLFEHLPALSRTAQDVYIEEVRKSDIYLGLIGLNYGFVAENGKSACENEYDAAGEKGLFRWAFLKSDSLPDDAHQRAFVQKINHQLKRNRFNNQEDLKEQVYATCVRFLQEQGLVRNDTFDSAFHSTASLADIDRDLVHEFVVLARAKRQFPLLPDTPVSAVLKRLQMTDGERITNSALLMFNKRPIQFFPSAVVKCAQFYGTIKQKPIPDFKTFEGTLPELLNQSLHFILAKINVAVGTRSNSPSVPVTPEIPPEALSEALVNALTHRNYYSNGSVQISVFADRVEIFNPGGLPAEITIDELLLEHGSFPANPRLAECMYQLGLIERFGTGTTDIIRKATDKGLKPPEFSEADGFKVIFWRAEPASDPTSTGQVPPNLSGLDDIFGQVPRNHPASTPQVTPQVPPNYPLTTPQPPPNYPLNSFEVVTVCAVMNGEMRASEIQQALGLGDYKNFRANYLKAALEAKIIRPTFEQVNHPRQSYRLTELGEQLRKDLEAGK